MWVVRMSDKQLEVLRALLRSEEHLGPALKGVVEAGALGVLYGAPGAYKSFIALDLAHHVAGGRADWAGWRVRRHGAVLYVAGEGNVKRRMQAWRIRAGASEDGDDVSDWEGAGRLIQTALDAFGRLDTLVNNAGILRDRMLVSMQEEEWDAVIKVHLKGTAAPMHHAANHWRERVKAGESNDARIINTSSAAGLFGNIGQTNYAAAKSGIAAMTRVASAELGRYGVNVNAIAPIGRTRMTENLFPDAMKAPSEGLAARIWAPV